MSPVLGREALEAMKRTEIQKLCKDYGVKANLKTEALIDLLLDASRPPAPRRNPPQPPQRPPSTRIPNLAGARPRGQSTSSAIDHNSKDEVEPTIPQRRHQIKQHEQIGPHRTKKAKETQYRLGVGRPVIAGGAGARTVTKPPNISRTPKRTRSSRSVKPSEATITEESELNNSMETHLHGKRTPGRPSDQSQLVVYPAASSSSKALETLIAEALAPVQRELDHQKAQLVDLSDKFTAFIQTFETKIRHLTLEIQDLRARAKNSLSTDSFMMIAQDQSVRIPEPPSTPKRVRTPFRPSIPLQVTESAETSDLSSDPSDLDNLVPPDSRSVDAVGQPGQVGSLLPGFPHSVLGKRPRDSASNDTSGAFSAQEGIEAALDVNVNRIIHKRAKPNELEDNIGGISSSAPPQAEHADSSGFSRRQTGPNFPVFSGEEDPPPPIQGLSNFYGPTSPPLISAPATSSANNIENQNPFGFTFAPIASTPAQAVYPLAMGTFPHPEPPTSPSPAVNPDRPGSRHSDRLGAFGVARSSSRTSGRAPSGGSLTRGEAGGSSGLQRAPSSNEVASGLGLTAIKTSATEQGTPAPPAKRTMYGTELDGDTRFGDFGVEGIASGFWAGGRF